MGGALFTRQCSGQEKEKPGRQKKENRGLAEGGKSTTTKSSRYSLSFRARKANRNTGLKKDLGKEKRKYLSNPILLEDELKGGVKRRRSERTGDLGVEREND